MTYSREIYFLTVLEEASPRAKYRQVWFLPGEKQRQGLCFCLADGLPSMFTLCGVSLRVLISSFDKDTSQTGLRPTLMSSF
jgi:hypothetical protein